MKTNVTLHSSDRELFGVRIKQNTKDCFLSITDLQKAYDIARWQYGWGEKHLPALMKSQSFKERVYHILNERGVVKVPFGTFMEMVEREGVVKVLKGLGIYKTTGRGENKSTYSDPYIWVLLAMEMNPLLYAKVVLWITDSLIFDRVDAGSEYLPMNTAIKSILPTPDYPKYAKAINNKVFGFHQTGMRNLASSSQLREISNIERYVTKTIENGFVKTELDVIKAIQNY